MGSENKRWPMLETYTHAPARQLTFQLWDGYGDKLDGTGLTFFLNAKLAGVSVITDLPLEAVDENTGLYRASFDFQEPGDHDAQIKVVNGVANNDYCEPLTIRVKDVI